MSEKYEYIVKGYWANVIWAEFNKELITKGVGMRKSDDLVKAKMDEKVNMRKEANKRKALDILDEAKVMNSGDDVVLRGDGSFASPRNQYVSQAEMLTKYHKLAKQVEQAYIHLNNSY